MRKVVCSFLLLASYADAQCPLSGAGGRAYVAKLQQLCCEGGGGSCHFGACSKSCAKIFIPALTMCNGTSIGRQLQHITGAMSFFSKCMQNSQVSIRMYVPLLI